MDLAPQQDRVGSPLSDELSGLTLEYRYSTGHLYRLTFVGPASVSFEQIEPPAPPPRDPQGNLIDASAPLPCRVRSLRPGMFLVHWLVRPGPGIHVSLVIDLERGELHSAAMMPPNQWEFFDTAEILRSQASG